MGGFTFESKGAELFPDKGGEGKGLKKKGKDMLPFSILYGLMKNEMGLVSRGEVGETT